MTGAPWAGIMGRSVSDLSSSFRLPAMALHDRPIASALAAGCLIISGVADAGPPSAILQGDWAGDRLQLVIDAQGGRVESDCASGRFPGPVIITGDGRFSVRGSFESRGGGPQQADAAAPAPPATFAGELLNSALTLTIAPATGAQPQVYRLQAGARIKLLRCL
jgi:hypothetical protein